MSSRSQQDSPLVIGLLIDVSSSMRRNWQNRDGQSTPRAQVVLNAIHEHIRWLSSIKRSNLTRETYIFCMGMGFKRPMYWTDVQISYGREEDMQGKPNKRTDVGVVCDVLALSEIVPSKKQLQHLQDTIGKKWIGYTKDMRDRVLIRNDVYQELEQYISSTIHESAYRKLRLSLMFRIYMRVGENRVITRSRLGKRYLAWLAKAILLQEGRINDASQRAGKKYLDGILNEAQEIFDANSTRYSEYIRKELLEFASQYSGKLLDLLALGHPTELVTEYFDEQKVMDLARKIYMQLEREVRRNIRRSWTIHRGALAVHTKTVRASLDSTHIRALTEKCVQRYSWDILQPFLERTVRDLFEDRFQTNARERLPKWIGWAASREVLRTPDEVMVMLPDSSFDETIFGDEFMFGSTPIGEAMNLASLRLLDRNLEQYRKVLVIVSDGEFSTRHPVDTARLLKQAGVLIVCCYVTERNIVNTLTSRISWFWPDGAKMMFDMASVITEEDAFNAVLLEKAFSVESGNKCFYQINHADHLQDILSGLAIES